MNSSSFLLQFFRSTVQTQTWILAHNWWPFKNNSYDLRCYALMNVNNMNGILQPNLTIFCKICFAFMFRRLCGGILFFSLTLKNAKKAISNCLFCTQSGKGVLQTRVGLFTAQMDFSVDTIRVNICLYFSGSV